VRTMMRFGKASTLLMVILLAAASAMPRQPVRRGHFGQTDLRSGKVDWAMDLPTLWRSVNAVAYVRIQKTLDTRTRQAGSESDGLYVEYQAVNLEAFRRFFGNPQSTFSFLQAAPDSLYPSAGPGAESDALCKQGEEYIVFLRWNDMEHLFQAHLVVPVREGQVRSLHIEEIRVGMKLKAFLTKLRSMQE
jgi:hypothetical protein